MKEKYGFVYIWRDRKHNRYYIGSHWGTKDDGYVCSSSWMKRAYKIRPWDFKRRILEINIEQKTLNEHEHYWLQKIKKKELGKRYYNLRNHRFGHWSTYNILSIGEKISKSQTGKKRGPMSEEHKRKIGDSNRGKVRSKDICEAISLRRAGKGGFKSPKKVISKLKGIKFSKNHKIKLSEARKKFIEKGGTSWNKGIAMKDETKLKISNTKIQQRNHI